MPAYSSSALHPPSTRTLDALAVASATCHDFVDGDTDTCEHFLVRPHVFVRADGICNNVELLVPVNRPHQHVVMTFLQKRCKHVNEAMKELWFEYSNMCTLINL